MSSNIDVDVPLIVDDVPKLIPMNHSNLAATQNWFYSDSDSSVTHSVSLCQELKKLGPWKSQLELQKKQISELQLKLDEERKTSDKFELQFKNLQEKNETLAQEKEVRTRSVRFCKETQRITRWIPAMHTRFR